jgi:hypothetical protein
LRDKPVRDIYLIFNAGYRVHEDLARTLFPIVVRVARFGRLDAAVNCAGTEGSASNMQSKD